jgi:hypothetical protein
MLIHITFFVPCGSLSVHARIASLRSYRDEQSKRLDAARSMLSQYVSDFHVTPDELKQLQQQLATQTEPSSTTAATMASRSKRRLQVNPLFTHNLSKFLSQLTSKLSKYRLHHIDELLKFYIIKRKSAASCTIIGLELMDDPDAMLHAARPANHAPPTDGAQVGFNGPPGTDPEVVAAALGYIVLVLHMLSCYLAVRLPYALRFHGSHSYVVFNDEESTRYFLTLLDNTNPNHFRRAITLLNHNIQYFCEKMTTGSTAATKGHNGHTDSLAALNLAPLHLLPNMLKLIESIFLQLRQSNSDPYIEHEQRVQQAIAMQKANQLPPQMQTTSLQQQHLLVQQQQQQQQYLPYPPDRVSSPHLFDASMSQSIVTVNRQDAFPMHRPSSGYAQPSFHRLESPPFYSDQSSKVASMSAASSYAPLDSPRSQGFGDLASPPCSADHDQEHARMAYSSSMPRVQPLPPPAMVRSDMLSPSQFFGLQPNGYLSAEEPRESVLFFAPTPTKPTQAPYGQRAHGSPGSEASPSAAYGGSDFGSPMPQTPMRAFASSPSTPSSASLSSTPMHLQQAIAAVMSPFNLSRAGSLPPPLHPPQWSSSSRSSVLPAVSYASEAEVDWDLVDVVTDETDQQHQAMRRRN